MSLFIGIHETESFELQTTETTTSTGEMDMKDVVSEGPSNPKLKIVSTASSPLKKNDSH